MSLREWGLATILLFSGCAVKEQQIPQNKIECDENIPHGKVDDYDIAMELKTRAETEDNQYIREAIFKRALKQFQTAREHGTKPLDSLIQEADIHSLIGDYETAHRTADKYIQQNPNEPLGWYKKATIDQRRNNHEDAAKHLTKAIELKDSPELRWERYISHIILSKEGTTQIEHLEKALEDINKYIEARKEEPDGYFYKGVAQCMLEEATNQKKHNKEAYETFKQGKDLLDQGKEFKRTGFNKEGILKTIKELKEHYEPEAKAENRNRIY
jgi:tetratricopeptide (TPR) repeat protein